MSGHVWSASNNSPVSRFVVAGAVACLCVLLFSCPNPASIGEIAADLGLSIVATIPQNGDSNFGPGQPIVVTFDRDLDPACIEGVAPVVIATDPQHPLTLTFSLDGPRKLVIDPHPFLESNHTYTVSLETTLKDSSGATLPQTVALTFTTGDAPAGDFKLNNGAAYVNTRNVTLDVQHNPVATRMRVAESETALASMTFVAFGSPDWELSDVDGSKTVYMQFANEDGSMTSPVRAVGVVLDRVAPIIDSASVAPYYNQSNDGSNALRPSLVASDATSGIDSCTWSGEGISFNTSAPYSELSPRLTIGGSNGPYSLSVTVRDRAGNSVTSQLLTTMKDASPPGSPWTGEVSPLLTLDPRHISWSWNAGSTQNPYQTPDTFDVTLNGSPVDVTQLPYELTDVQDGTYTLAVVQRDAAGNGSPALVMPIVVTPVIPPDGSLDQAQSQYLMWRPLGLEAPRFKYRIYLWPSDALPVLLPDEFTNHITGPLELDPGKTYYWYIELSPDGNNSWPIRGPTGDGTYYRFTTIQ